MVMISDDVNTFMIHCGFNIRSNYKDIDEDDFESLQDIMSLDEKKISNFS